VRCWVRRKSGLAAPTPAGGVAMGPARRTFVGGTPILVLMLSPYLNAHDHGTHEPSAMHMADIVVASVTRVTHDGSACHIWLWRIPRFLPPPGDTARRYVRRGFGNRGSAPSKQNSLSPSIMLPQLRKEPLIDRYGVGAARPSSRAPRRIANCGGAERGRRSVPVPPGYGIAPARYGWPRFRTGKHQPIQRARASLGRV